MKQMADWSYQSPSGRYMNVITYYFWYETIAYKEYFSCQFVTKYTLMWCSYRTGRSVFMVMGHFILSIICQFKDPVAVLLMPLQCAERRALVMKSYTSETHYRSLLLLETKECHDHSRHMSRERQGQRLSADNSTAIRERHEWGVPDSLQFWLSLSKIAWNYSSNDANTDSLCCSANCCSYWTRVAQFDIGLFLLLIYQGKKKIHKSPLKH